MVTQEEAVQQDMSRLHPDPAVQTGQPQEQLTLVDTVTSDEEGSYSSGMRVWMSVVACCAVSFLHGLDLTIVSATVPSLTNYFRTVGDIGWYSSAYSLMTASFSFLAGKLYSIMSLKKMFIIFLVIFEVGSLICTVAVTSWMFILGRAIAGVGSAGVVAGSYMTITHCFPSQKRSIWTTVMGSSQFLGIVSAPLLGGALIDWIGWRGCFGINLPLGVIATIMICFGFQEKPVSDGTENSSRNENSWRHKLRRFDWIGTVCLMPSICCMLLALQWGGHVYRWKDARIISLFSVSVVLFGGFAWRQHRLQDDATLPPRIFRMRSVLAAAWYSSCINATLSITEYYMSIYYQGVKGYSATRSGLLMVPMLVGIAVGNLFGGAGSAWTGYYNPFMIATTLLAPIASGLLTTISLDEGVVKAASLLGFLGVATGIGIQTPILALQTIMKSQDLPTGIAAITFGASMGNAIWVVVSAAVFQGRLVSEVQTHSPSVNTTLLSHAGLSEIAEIVGQKRLHDVLVGYDEAVTQTLYLPVGLTIATLLGSALVEWHPMKKKQS